MDLPRVLAERVPMQPQNLHTGFMRHAALSPTRLEFRLGDGPWLEQLACRLATRDGYAIQYFGRNGQSQFGIDLIGTRGSGLAYWQCKNHRTSPAEGDLAKWVNKILDEAISQQGLPLPQELFLCSPHEIKSTPVNGEFIDMHGLLARMGCDLHWWGHEHLCNALRPAPDIVAELFGDVSVALHCPLDTWHADMWLPLDGQLRHSSLTRYLQTRNTNGVWRLEDEDVGAWPELTDCMEHHVLSIVRGPSGAGKTFAVLDLCEQSPGWCTYFLNLRQSLESYNPAAIAKGMVSRSSRPSIFVIDDIHDHLDSAEDVVDRFQRLQSPSAAVRIACIARSALAKGAGSDIDIEASDWLASLQADGAMVDHTLDTKALRAFVRHRRSDWAGHRNDAIDRLAALCAGNLYLLEEACSALDKPTVATRDSLREVLAKARGRLTVPASSHLSLVKAAALAQYELPIPTAYIARASLEELESFARRTDWADVTGHPPRLHFTHAAAAEMALHSFFDPLQGTSLTEFVAGELRAFLHWTMQFDEAWLSLLRQIVRQRPAWLSGAEDAAIKLSLLSAASFADQWLETARRDDPGLIALALYIAVDAGHETAASRFATEYMSALHERVRHQPPIDCDTRWIESVGLGLRSLRLHDEAGWRSVLAGASVGQWLAWVIRASLPDLLRLLANATPSFAADLIMALDTAAVQALVAKTLKHQRSIGTAGLLLRDLQSHDRALGRSGNDRLLAKFERKITPQGWLPLLAKATLPTLLRLLEYSTPEFADDLIEALDVTAMQALVANTIEERRSIGTTGIQLRELQTHDQALGRTGDARLLAKLERKVTPQGWLRLLGDSTLPDLLQLLSYSTTAFATRLLEQLDQSAMDRLVGKTVERQRSIGSIGILLRTLKGNDEALGLKGEDRLLATIERKVTVSGWLRLLADASLPDLLGILQYATEALATELASALDDSTFERLVLRAEVSGRGTTTVGMGLRYQSTKLGPRRVATALVRLCPLGSMFHLVDGLDETRRGAFVAELAARPEELWVSMCERSAHTELFFEVSELLAAWTKFAFDRQPSSDRVRQALQRQALASAEGASWYALHTGLRKLGAPHAVALWAAHLCDLPRQRAQALNFEALRGLPAADFNAVRDAIWRYREDLVQPWLERAADLLNSNETPAADLVRWGPALLFWLHDLRCDDTAAIECVDRIVRERLAAFVEARDSVQTFLLLWNALVVAFERTQQRNASLFQFAHDFGQRVDQASRDLILSLLENETRLPMAAQRIGKVLPLVGMVGVLDWARPDTPGLSFELPSGKLYPLSGVMGQQGFVAGTLMQIGAEWVMGDRKAWAVSRVELLRQKFNQLLADADATVPRAVIALSDWVENRVPGGKHP